MPDEEPLIQRYVYRGNNPSKAKIVTRSYTKNARDPSPAQATQRLRVGRASKLAKGMKMKEGDALPPAAKLVKDYARGSTGMPTKKNMPIWKKELDDFLTLKLRDKDDKERQIKEIFQILEGVRA
jgi:hypothetical protein